MNIATHHVNCHISLGNLAGVREKECVVVGRSQAVRCWEWNVLTVKQGGAGLIPVSMHLSGRRDTNLNQGSFTELQTVVQRRTYRWAFIHWKGYPHPPLCSASR